MKKSALAFLALALMRSISLWAATPASGELTESSGPQTFTGGPYFVNNPGGLVNGVPPGGETCDVPMSCDSYVLTVNIADKFRMDKKNDKEVVQFIMTPSYAAAPADGVADIDLHLKDASGTEIAKSEGGTAAEAITMPLKTLKNGSYTVLLVTGNPLGSSESVEIRVGRGSKSFKAEGLGINLSHAGNKPGGPDLEFPEDARYQTFVPPSGIGAEGSGGEYSIGFNPKTGNIMVNSLGFSTGPIDVAIFSTKVFRVTPPEKLAAALDESCDAQWLDKSNLYNNTPQVLSDPILWTDQDTGRTFSANLTTGPNPTSEYAFTDDDGDLWIPAGLGIAGADHETIVTGFYPAGSPFETVARTVGYGLEDASGAVVKGKATYFCSQDVIGPGTCTRSDDGGISWSPPQLAYASQVGECGGLHGHLRVALDGTVYLPVGHCGRQQGGSYTTDAGLNWNEFKVPDTEPQSDGSDPSFAIDDANTLYYCYVDVDGHPKVRVGNREASGLVWGKITDLGSAHGLENAVFPEAIGGDPGRAACGFLGTQEFGGGYQRQDFAGVWHLYVATTTDGGDTWTVVNATPNDPVQGTGGIWQQGGGGDGSSNNRNLLDFNEITLDDKGRVLFGYNDGCVGTCDLMPINIDSSQRVAHMRVVRQTGGKSLRAAFDPMFAAPRAPGVACLNGADKDGNVELVWNKPDHGGSALSYKVERVLSNGTAQMLGTTTATTFTVANSSLASSAYRVISINKKGSTPSKTVGAPGAKDAPLVVTVTSGKSGSGLLLGAFGPWMLLGMLFFGATRFRPFRASKRPR